MHYHVLSQSSSNHYKVYALTHYYKVYALTHYFHIKLIELIKLTNPSKINEEIDTVPLKRKHKLEKYLDVFIRDTVFQV